MEDLIKKIVATLLWETQAVKISVDKPFQLASCNFSPIYINCRSLISHPVAMDLICAAIHWCYVYKKLKADVIAGGETAGIPFAAYVAQRLSKPMVYVRKQPKGYGLGSSVEGSLAEGQRVFLVEDLITDGGSKEAFILGLRNAGAVVEHCLAVFDREQGGKAFLSNMGVTLHGLCNLKLAIEVGVKSQKISETSKQEVDNYLRDQKEWHAMRGLEWKV